MLEEMMDHGGLPMHLDGAPMTCHGQQADGDHRTSRERLDPYAQDGLTAEAVIPMPCNVPEITP